MDINDAVKTTKLLFASGQAAIWESPPGMGKSQVAFQLFTQLRDDGATRGERWGFGQIFAATQTPPDLIGYQFKGERCFPVIDKEGNVTFDDGGKPIMGKPVTVTDPSVPLWMIDIFTGRPASDFDKFFLLIEEYGQGEGDVKRACAEIFLNGGTAPWYLPPGSVRLGLTNSDARDGVTKDFDFAIARRTRIKITPSIEAFLKWCDKPYMHQGRQWEIMPVTKAWAAANPQAVFEDKPAQQGPWCNPRQLAAMDRYAQLSFESDGHNEFTPYDLEVAEGTIGMAASVSYAAHMQFLTSLPQYADVVSDPDNTPVPDKADLKMLMAYQLASLAKVPDMGAVLKYIGRMPKDMGVTFVTALLRRDYKGMMATPAMQAWINKNAALVSVISTLG